MIFEQKDKVNKSGQVIIHTHTHITFLKSQPGVYFWGIPDYILFSVSERSQEAHQVRNKTLQSDTSL